MVNAEVYAMKLRSQMEQIKHSMVEPGYTSDFDAYRAQFARYHALKGALELLKVTLQEDNE